MAELFKMKLLDVNKNQILPETSADQVTMTGGGNVEAKIKSLESAFAAGTRLLGTVGTEGTVETLPADSYQLGDMYVVKTAGTYASQVCEPGDLILCVKAYAEEGAADTDWTVIQNNVVRAVKGPESATDGNLMAFVARPAPWPRTAPSRWPTSVTPWPKNTSTPTPLSSTASPPMATP